MAYIGNKEAYPIIIDGLKKMEYRGYDSAGVAIMNGSLSLIKKEGKVKFLENFAKNEKTDGNLALGHTRWATHGVPSDSNAHPHTSQSGELVMVHNGIIENYQNLKYFLLSKGYKFKSETDSEVLVQYIEWYQTNFELSLKEATRLALGGIEGSYAIVIMDTRDPHTLVVAKNDNPLAIGLAGDGFYIASDPGPISAYTKDVIFLQDHQVATLSSDGFYGVYDLENVLQDLPVKEVERQTATYDKGEFDSFMLKEIFHQPDTIRDCIAGRLDFKRNEVLLPAVTNNLGTFQKANRIVIVACGTSWHAGLIGEYLIESLAKVPVEVEYASEFRYREPILQKGDIVIAISQSGETADTLAAIKLANEKGAFTYSLVNAPESTIARHSAAVSMINAGREIGVASTKAFTGQVSLLTLLALKLGQLRANLPATDVNKVMKAMLILPEQISRALETAHNIEKITKSIVDKDHALFLGRGLNFPVALEGALKLKEISYIHAEGYPAAEMKHGPIALVDKNLPVFVLATNESCFQKLMSNVQEIKSRNGQIILIKNEDQDIPEGLADFVVNVPKVAEILSPIMTTIPLQLFSYFAAKQRGCDIDQPRNLAKSVTVE
jgi:glucosamine--fructose-6-phosphate aminotransferase (isomerizing)